MTRSFAIILICLCGLSLAACQSSEQAEPPATRPVALLATMPIAATEQIPAIATRQAMIETALQNSPPVIPLSNLVGDLITAQTLALQNSEVLRYVYDANSGQPFWNEVMSVRPALASDLAAIACTPDACYRLELYNYALNITTVVLVDTAVAQVAHVSHQSNIQPEIPPYLAELAVQIASQSPDVIAALAGEPARAVMTNVKTALNGSQCERSQHLCVAPTFIVDEVALWAIVDLTDQKLVGIRWTNLGQSGPTPPVTESTLQNEIIYETYCRQSQQLSQQGWQMDYMLTSSDGLKVANAHYQDKLVLTSATLVDWHVSYSREDGFGYSDAVGCPIFSSAAVIAYTAPYTETIEENGAVIGFALSQDFRNPAWPAPCNYRYEQRYEFYEDGRFRIAVANHGRGCGDDGTYRPVLRLDVAASADGRQDSFANWDGQSWQEWPTENWQEQASHTTPEGYLYRLTAANGAGYYIEPNQGQFSDGSRGDNAFIYLSRTSPEHNEGQADLPTLGSCCNNDYQQGPEKFITPAEATLAQDLVIWYVPQLRNEAPPGATYCWADAIIEDGLPVARSWPCYAGPMFVPIP